MSHDKRLDPANDFRMSTVDFRTLNESKIRLLSIESDSIIRSTGGCYAGVPTEEIVVLQAKRPWGPRPPEVYNNMAHYSIDLLPFVVSTA